MSAAQQWAVRLTWPDGSVAWVSRIDGDFALSDDATKRAVFGNELRADAEASEWKGTLWHHRSEIATVDVVRVERMPRVRVRRRAA